MYATSLYELPTLCKFEPSTPKEETFTRYAFTPHHNTPAAYPNANQATVDFAKFLAKRELVTQGLVKFSDRPQHYRACRSAFQSVIQGLDLSCREQIELLVKWLGNDSAEHAKRIRDININHPEIGLTNIWNRLDRCYGSPEAIESTLFKRIEDFPKIPSRGYQRLREFSDLCMELQVAKAEGDLPGLSYLDSARGINSLAQKLPYELHERWITHGCNYKRKHNVPFPPFSEFVDFVDRQAGMKDDPSFIFPVSYTTSSGPKQLRAPVAVHKTNISSHRFAESQPEDQDSDPTKFCPLHKMPHPLPECRAFRTKTIKDRKAFLKENNVCYKCCSSSTHFAKDCKVSVKCTECDSTEHNTALHPRPTPRTFPPVHRDKEQGGETKDSRCHSNHFTVH